MTITVDDTTSTPTHHASLTDGSTTVGFIFADSQGRPDVRAAKRYPLQRTAIKTSEGASKYSDLELPYLSIAQDDWSGGRGQETFDDDNTRYFDSCRMFTAQSGFLYPEGVETFGKGYRSQDMEQPGDYTPASWKDLVGNNRYLANDFSASATYNADYVELWIAKVGTPGTLTVELRTSDHTGAVLKTSTLTAASVSDVTARFHRFDWTGTEALTATNGYSIVIYGASGDTTSNCWQVAVGTMAGYSSPNNTDWDVETTAPFFRVAGADTSGLWWQFFEYKRTMYAISKPVTGNSFLYINGDRGAADSNSGALSTLVDASKSWTTDEWIGNVVLIVKGPGSEEEQPWRSITDNDGTTLTVSPSWNVEHTTSTEYVILGSKKWTSELDLGGFVTDVAVADEFVYFARGDSGALGVLRYQAYNNAGTWTTRNTAETEQAVHLCVIRDTVGTGNSFLWGTQNAQAILGKKVWKGKIPRFWGNLYTEVATLTTPAQPFSELAIANVTQNVDGYSTSLSVAAAFGTGVIASEIITAVNITQGNRLAFEAKSTVAQAENDITLKYSDTADLGGGVVTMGLEAMAANTWQWITEAISMNSGGASLDHVEDAVISVGLAVAVDNGAFTLQILDGIKLISTVLERIKLPASSKITGIIPYAGNATDPVINPWVITETGVYEIQSQNDNQVVELPIGEIKELRSEINGKAVAVNDVYLWFNLASRLERYYSRNLDDVGPDRDAGLPSDRIGNPADLLSYPGRVYAAIDGGSSNTSSVLMYDNGWHEVYRGHRAGTRILNVWTQSIPGEDFTSRMWVSQGPDILWVPVSINPAQASSFKHAVEGHIESSWMYAGMQDVTKFFKSLTVFSDGTASVGDIYLDYKIDQDTTWTVVGKYATYYNLEKDFSSTNSVRGNRIKIRLRFRTLVSSTPVLKAWLLKGIGIVPIKHGYTWTSKLTEGNLNIDLWNTMGNAHGSLTTVDTVLAKLDDWASAATVLTLRSIYSPLDNKTVVLEDPGISPMSYIPEENPGPLEEFVVQVSCIDI